MVAVSAIQMRSILIGLRFSKVFLREAIFLEASLVKDIFSLAGSVLKLESAANIKKYKCDIKIKFPDLATLESQSHTAVIPGS